MVCQHRSGRGKLRRYLQWCVETGGGVPVFPGHTLWLSSSSAWDGCHEGHCCVVTKPCAAFLLAAQRTSAAPATLQPALFIPSRSAFGVPSLSAALCLPSISSCPDAVGAGLEGDAQNAHLNCVATPRGPFALTAVSQAGRFLFLLSLRDLMRDLTLTPFHTICLLSVPFTRQDCDRRASEGGGSQGHHKFRPCLTHRMHFLDQVCDRGQISDTRGDVQTVFRDVGYSSSGITATAGKSIIKGGWDGRTVRSGQARVKRGVIIWYNTGHHEVRITYWG